MPYQIKHYESCFVASKCHSSIRLESLGATRGASEYLRSRVGFTFAVHECSLYKDKLEVKKTLKIQERSYEMIMEAWESGFRESVFTLPYSREILLQREDIIKGKALNSGSFERRKEASKP